MTRKDGGEGFPLVAIVGSPNVGKSRLFNRLTGKSTSIVHDRPGVTRDRLEGLCAWQGRQFRLLDTGGLVPGGRDDLETGVERQVLRAIGDAELLIMVVDGRAGATPLDESLAAVFRRSGRPTLLAVNKVDAEGQEGRVSEFFGRGFPEPIPISAEEGRGISTLLDQIVALLPATPDQNPPEAADPAPVGLAVVGRPNVGKSTLFNRLVGDERAVVSPLPGTTRDPVDALFEHRGRRYRIVDTAGLRRHARRDSENVEMLSIEKALASMRRADLVVALMDAAEPVTHQDLAVLGACQRVRRPLVVVLNKADQMGRNPDQRAKFLEAVRGRIRFAEDPPVLLLSALQGEGIDELLEILDRMAAETCRKVSTPDLNRALEVAIRKRSPAGKGKIPRLYYITQTGVSPPSFVIFTNGAGLESSYRKYLARSLRDSLGFNLVPVSLRFRARPQSS